MTIKTYRDLDVWQKSMDLAVAVYAISHTLPQQEKYTLTSQMDRAVILIASNIAEGHAKGNRAEYLRHLSNARGSLAEVETHLALAGRLELITREQALPAWNLAQNVGQMLNKLIAALQRGQE